MTLEKLKEELDKRNILYEEEKTKKEYNEKINIGDLGDMVVFNLAEELEKERKKNKELQGNIDVLVNSNCQLNEYIDKLEQDNKELEELLKSANESITWWSNRYKGQEATSNTYLSDFEAQAELTKEYKDRIDKATEIIKKYGYEKQMKEDYLMNRVNLANYNCLLLDILQGDNK